MKAFLVLVLLIVTAISALANGYWLLFRLTYVLAAVLVLSFVWSRSNLRWLKVVRLTRTQRAQVGKTAQEKFVVHNTGPLPKLWLELHDHSNMPGHYASAAISLGGRRSAAWTVDTLCRVRGEFTLGPITVTSSDPFGLFTQRLVIPDTRTLIVYPRMVDLPGFAVPSGELPRDSRYHRRTAQVSPNAYGVRDYVPGDGFNRIHWPTTARAGKLMVKEFEMDPSSDVWIVLDLHSSVHVGQGEESTEEYAVTIAASLAKRLLEANLAVGLVAHDRGPRLLNPDRSGRQLLKALEWLAVVRAEGRQPLAEVIAAESIHFSRHTSLIVITPSTDESWVASLQELRHRGVRSAAVVLEASTFGVPDSSLLIVSALAASRVPAYLVKRGEDLSQALVTAAANSI